MGGNPPEPMHRSSRNCHRTGSNPARSPLRLNATPACPWDGAAKTERCALWCRQPPPLRSQRWVTKRQPAGTGRRSPARLRLTRRRWRLGRPNRRPRQIGQRALHRRTREQHQPARGVALRRLSGMLHGATNLPARRSAQGGKAPARRDGQALARAASPCSRAGERGSAGLAFGS